MKYKRLRVFQFTLQLNVTMNGAGVTAEEAKEMARANFESYLQSGVFADFDDYLIEVIPTNEYIDTDQEDESNE